METQVHLLRWVVVLTIIGEGYASPSQIYGNNQRTLTARTIREAIEKAKEINRLRKSVDNVKRDLEIKKSYRCPLSLHHGKRESGDSAASRKANDALLTLRILMQEYGYSPDELQTEAATRTLREIEEFECELPDFAPCNFSSKYRTLDGSCNNEHNPRLGMAGMIQQRLVESDYDDGIGSPRSKGLPNARTVSNIVHANQNQKEDFSKQLTAQTFSFGQFLDHDIAMTPKVDVDECCEKDDPENCFNIVIERDDKFSDVFVKGYCMEIKRSFGLLCPNAMSEKKRRQQTNSITSFVDASNVYGSSESKLAELRDEDHPYLLKTQFDENQFNKMRLPSGPRDACIVKDPNQNCSIAGDARVDEVPSLATMHFLFVLEHNRIAKEIIKHYNDSEIAFQEARRILIAVMQKIVYDEFLAALFSPEGLKYYRLLSSNTYTYDPKLDPTIINGFSAAAYRFGHTLIPPEMKFFSRDLVQNTPPDFSLPTEDTFHDPNMTFAHNGYSRLAYGLSGCPARKRDSTIDDAVRNNLFKEEDEDGQIMEAGDLAAINIQRGRDHGLPSYHEYRNICNLPPVDEHWDHSNGADSGLTDHTPEIRKLLKLAGYKSPRDIDIFTGSVSEKNVNGGVLGPTLECIIGEQFRRLKFGDRFWYQNNNRGFTKRQIKAIGRYSFAKVLCNNYNFEKINFPNAFLLKNKRTECTDIPDLDLSEFVPAKDYAGKCKKRSLLADTIRSNEACIKAFGQCTNLRLNQRFPNTKCRSYCECLADNVGYYWSRIACDKGKSFNPSNGECVEVPYPTCDFLNVLS